MAAAGAIWVDIGRSGAAGAPRPGPSYTSFSAESMLLGCCLPRLRRAAWACVVSLAMAASGDLTEDGRPLSFVFPSC
eukprot:6214073-Pleurochrysis_carterae.AAC.2